MHRGKCRNHASSDAELWRINVACPSEGRARGFKETYPLNNNRNTNNNRRRGRGGNRQQGGGGQQLNRIDSRARGNAPQMLEKYRKLAHDAHLNGDRVQEEYYLQFADHYFRVIADQRQRQDEGRVPRQDRWQEGGDGAWREDGEEQSEGAGEGEYAAYDQQQSYPRRDRQDRFREESPREAAPVEESRAEEIAVETAREDTVASDFEPAENPFVKENRGTRGLRPRREDRPGRPPRQGQDERGQNDSERGEFAQAPSLGLDPASLPPAISAGREAGREDDEAVAEASLRPPRRTRRPRPPADDAGEALEAVT